MSHNIKFLLFLIFICMAIGLFTYNNSCQKWVVHNIEYGFHGIITDKVEVRKGITSHVKIKLNQKDTLVFLNKIELVSVGDSIIKMTNSPFYYYKHDNLWHKQIFEIIPKKLRNSKCFPKRWENKCSREWKEACL